MEFLRITATNGIKQYIPDNYVVKIVVSADTLDAGSDYAAPKVASRGKITSVSYYDGANTTAGAIVVATVAAYDSTNALYEFGVFGFDGTFNTALRN